MDLATLQRRPQMAYPETSLFLLRLLLFQALPAGPNRLLLDLLLITTYLISNQVRMNRWAGSRLTFLLHILLFPNFVAADSGAGGLDNAGKAAIALPITLIIIAVLFFYIKARRAHSRRSDLRYESPSDDENSLSSLERSIVNPYFFPRPNQDTQARRARTHLPPGMELPEPRGLAPLPPPPPDAFHRQARQLTELGPLFRRPDDSEHPAFRPKGKKLAPTRFPDFATRGCKGKDPAHRNGNSSPDRYFVPPVQHRHKHRHRSSKQRSHSVAASSVYSRATDGGPFVHRQIRSAPQSPWL
jgi:hypothetical protein